MSNIITKYIYVPLFTYVCRKTCMIPKVNLNKMAWINNNLCDLSVSEYWTLTENICAVWEVTYSYGTARFIVVLKQHTHTHRSSSPISLGSIIDLMAHYSNMLLSTAMTTKWCLRFRFPNKILKMWLIFNQPSMRDVARFDNLFYLNT
jgi:hypothetical protein